MVGVTAGAERRLTEKKVTELKKDLEALQAQLEVERGRAKRQVDLAVRARPTSRGNHEGTATAHVSTAESSAHAVAETSVLVEVNERFVLVPDEAVYLLVVETQTPLDTVVLQSSTALQLFQGSQSMAFASHGISGGARGNHGGESLEPELIISVSPVSGIPMPSTSSSIIGADAPSSSNGLLATVRCVNTSRMHVKVVTTEGQSGSLVAYVLPHGHNQLCRMLTFAVKPLSLHRRVGHTKTEKGADFEARGLGAKRVDESGSVDEGPELHTVTMKGNFTLADVHSWVAVCLPDVPERYKKNVALI